VILVGFLQLLDEVVVNGLFYPFQLTAAFGFVFAVDVLSLEMGF